MPVPGMALVDSDVHLLVFEVEDGRVAVEEVLAEHPFFVALAEREATNSFMVRNMVVNFVVVNVIIKALIFER